jgi:hypothetical protein
MATIDGGMSPLTPMVLPLRSCSVLIVPSSLDVEKPGLSVTSRHRSSK